MPLSPRFILFLTKANDLGYSLKLRTVPGTAYGVEGGLAAGPAVNDAIRRQIVPHTI